MIDDQQGRIIRRPIKEHTILLLKLNAACIEFGNDSTKADEVRNQMDASWHRMSDAEQEEIRGLSALLNDFSEKHCLEVSP